MATETTEWSEHPVIAGVREAAPARVAFQDHDPQRYLNREVSWLQFNWRVMGESENPSYPLLERLRFLSISASNLDEFLAVRVAGLKGQVAAHVDTQSQDGLTPAEQLERIDEDVELLVKAQQRRWSALRKEMATEGIEVVAPHELNADERQWVEQQFEDNIFALLTPISIDLAHQFPFIPPFGLAVGLSLQHTGDPKITKNGVVPVPAQFGRFIRLPTADRSRRTRRPDRSGTIRFLRIEQLIEMFVPRLFIGFEAASAGVFRVLRDSDIEIEEEAEDLVRFYESALKRRRRGSVIRLEIDRSMPARLKEFIVRELEVTAGEAIVQRGLVGLADTSELIVKERPDLLFKPFTARFPERIREYDGDCFAAIRAKDIIVHHPYESFDAVIHFLRQAVRDPDVSTIKWTLYRTSEDSPIVEALTEAAQGGKSVTAIVELQARFDEAANLRWARNLENAGAHVVFGFVRYKTHAKLGQVVRNEGGKLVSYCHIGTGNYHPVTAKVYTDLSYFTAEPVIGRDVTSVFNFITSTSDLAQLKSLSVSPFGMKARILQHIADEISNAESGKPAGIWMKMNALVDTDIIDALYRASAAGVSVELICRGICCLRPGVAGLSDNIRVKSIVGRFLEHARIYCFGNGHELPSPEALVYISSADMMPRNLERRVEVMAPIANRTVHEQVLEQIMLANLKDNQQSWIADDAGGWQRYEAPHLEPFNAHEYFMNNPSLSGRGGSLKGSTPPRIAVTTRGAGK